MLLPLLMFRAFCVTQSRKKGIRIWLCLYGFQNILLAYKLIVPLFLLKISRQLIFLQRIYDLDIYAKRIQIFFFSFNSLLWKVETFVTLVFSFIFKWNPTDRFSQKNRMWKSNFLSKGILDIKGWPVIQAAQWCCVLGNSTCFTNGIDK